MQQETYTANPQYLRTRAACEFARVGRTWLHQQVRAGRITPLRPSPRVALYRVADLQSLIEGAAPAEDGAA